MSWRGRRFEGYDRSAALTKLGGVVHASSRLDNVDLALPAMLGDPAGGLVRANILLRRRSWVLGQHMKLQTNVEWDTPLDENGSNSKYVPRSRKPGKHANRIGGPTLPEDPTYHDAQVTSSPCSGQTWCGEKTDLV